VVHRLRTEDVCGAETPENVVREFVQFAAGAVLVGHFVQHDLDIIDKESAEGGMSAWKRNREHIDTARIYRWNELHRMHYPVEGFDERTLKLDLASVAAHYGVPVDEAHHALADAFVTAQVWQKQIAMLAARGISTWGALRKSCR